MSKFKESFDGIEAGEELKRDTINRIKEAEKAAANRLSAPFTKKPRRGWKIALITMAACLAVIMAFPSYLAMVNAIGNPRYNFSKARPVKSESRLSALLSKEEYAPLTFGIKEKTLTSSDSAPQGPQGDIGAQGTAGVDGKDGSTAHSTTNVQVEGVDEGDIIKNDGEYIYRLSTGGFNIVKTDNGQLEKVCDIPIENFTPIEMYVRGNQLILIGGGYKQMWNYDIYDLIDGGYMYCMSYHTNVQIRIFDLSDIVNPVETRFYQMEGYYNTSRIQEETETLYFVMNYYNSYYYYDGLGKDKAQARRPYCRNDENKDAEPLPVDDIYYFKNVPNKQYMILGAINLNDSEKDAEIKAYLSCANITYVSGENLYISSFQSFYGVLGDTSETRSYIAKFSLSDLGFKGSNSVNGTLKDRYCLDEYNGYLRVATSYGWGRSSASAVYVFNKKMKEVSKLTNIAPGEAIDSATFSGDKGYISTSPRWILSDPLFIIDFSDVSHPKISEGLKEDGINNYMKAIDSTGYVLGFGTDSDSATTAWWGGKTGVKVQLYDMSGDEAVSVAKLTVEGNCSYAEVLSNPKALLYMYDENAKTGIIGFAAEQAGYYGSNYNYAINRQGLFLYSFDAAAGTLKEIGLLSNFDTNVNVYSYSYNDYKYQDMFNRYSRYVKRGIVIGGYIYTVADSVIAAYDLKDLTVKTAELIG